MKTRTLGAIGAAILLTAWVQGAQAYSFTLTQQDPDIAADFLTVNYSVSAGTGTLAVTGFAATINPAGTQYSIFSTSTYTLNASINASTGALLSGNLTIDGKVGSPLNYTSGVLLTGTLTGLSYQGGQSIVYLTFAPTGGDAVTPGGLYTTGGGIILNMAMTTTGDLPPASTGTFWASAFNNNLSGNQGVSDNFAQTVPEPVSSTLTVMGLGLLACAGRRRRRAA
jgi:hypothetical protein